ncbi:MAG: hypothetical protein HY233_01730 [Acidobacteriales bacterium]|nr:hypothetical protein [Terriglobales bacterium]
MASARAATSRSREALGGHTGDVLHALILQIRSAEKIAEFMFKMGESLLENNKRCKKEVSTRGIAEVRLQIAEVRRSHLLRAATFKQKKSIRTRALQESQTAFMNAPGEPNRRG